MADLAAGDSPALQALLEHLKRERGFDFTGYKRSSLERRITKRIGELDIPDVASYLDHLEVHPEEFEPLFNTIMINVTGFFRDPEAWEALARDVVPRILESKTPRDPIRIWSAGCASGEEPYTLAMLFAEALGEEQYLERVKIFATDVDEEALTAARQATYPKDRLDNVSEERVQRFFVSSDDRCAFRADLRRSVIFGRNDLVQDAPISRVDLLACRNTLMYFTGETQGRILRRFHFALEERGHLFLGRSEMLITHTDLFETLDMKHRLFVKVGRTPLRERLRFALPDRALPRGAREPSGLRESVLDASPVAQIVVDPRGALIIANREARRLLGLASSDINRPIQDLEISYRPIELRSQIDLAVKERRVVTTEDAEWATAGGPARRLSVEVAPLVSDEELVGVRIAYLDRTDSQALGEELETTRGELSAAYEELQSTVEELETTNEELQSTNEELETTNEELQSTNEELETTNEELQSTNEELETMNDELRQRSLELNEVNLFLETILGSMGVAVMVIDRSQQVQIWNRHAEGLWGLPAGEAEGQHVLSLDIGLPTEQLKDPIRSCLGGESEREELLLDATVRSGREITCHVTCIPLRGTQRPSGVIVLMEEREDVTAPA